MTRKKPTPYAHLARIYLGQASMQRHRGAWHATLLRWAANCRKAHQKHVQKELFP